MSLASRKLIQATAGAGVDTGDDDFANVVLLLDGDGTSGDANNTFTDSSPNGFTVTETGSVVQGSFSPYGDNWSNYFASGANVLKVTDSADFDLGTTWTVEAWIFPNAANGSKIFGTRNGSGNMWELLIYASDKKFAFEGYGANNTSGPKKSSSTFEPGQWYHVAVVTSSSATKLYVDGVLEVNYSNSYTWSTSYGPWIGGTSAFSEYAFDGYVSNLRVVKGTAVYTSEFTPPTEPLTAITNTVLLTCQSNRFVDNSSSSHTITVTGTPKVTPFSPFKNDDARDITVDGGSANFDSSEYLTIADNASLDVSGAMTAEIWVYITDMPDANIGSSGSGYLFNRWTASGNQRSWGIFVGANGAVSLYVSNSGSSSYTTSNAAAGSVGLYRWHHVAVSWDGSNQRLFIDGDLKATTANTSGPFSTSSAGVTVNSLNVSVTGTNMNAYYSDARYFANYAVYTADFDVPTEPLGNVVGTAGTINYVEYENKSFSVSSQVINPESLEFNSDGTKMYVLSLDDDAVYQYALTTAFDVSTASYDNKSFSVTAQEPSPRSVRFKTDGSKMYIVGQGNDTVYQYSLSTSYDVSTASYDSVSFSVASQSTNPQGLAFSSDGTKMYVIGGSTDSVYQYTLSTAWDISTASYDNKSLSVNAQEAAPTAVLLNNDGTKIFIIGSSSDRIRQYSMTTAYDLSTASFAGISYFVRPEETNPKGLAFNSDETKIYIVGGGSDTVYQYDLTAQKQPEVLLNFQDAGIYDRSGLNNLDTVGNARLGFAPIYGTGSLAFDGTGDYLSMPVEPRFDFGTANFTIESWVNLSATGQFNPIIYLGRDTYTGIACDVSSSNNPRIIADIGGSWGVVATGSTSLTTNQWYHLAFVRNGSSFKIYVDGVEDASATNSGSITAATSDSNSVAHIGYLRTNGGADRYFNGYLDDVRVTKGIARYTSDFTPPDEIDLSTDTHREYVTLFLDGDGTANGQNNTFTDSSTNGFTVTKNGSVAQGVFSPYGDNWSNSFDGNSDALTIPDSADFDFGTGDFTMEAWVYPAAFTGNYNQNNIISAHEGTDNTAYSFAVYSDGRVQLYGAGDVGGAHNDFSTSTISLNEWAHVMVTRSSGTVRFFINGTLDASTYTRTGNYNCTAQGLAIAKQPIDTGGAGATRYWNGWLSNVRMIKGTALHTASFTPSTTPLTAVTNTVLLACQSNRFVDNSSSSHTLTPTGTASVTRFSPFESNKPYDITVDGGSGYFDVASTAYLSFSGGPSSVSDMTISGWVYPKTMAPQAGNAYPRVFAAGGFLIYVRDDDIRIYNGGEKVQAPINNNEWTYFAAQRNSNTWTLYINGVSKGTASDSSNIALNSTNYIGSNGASNYFTGYIADLRIATSGSTSTAVPTSPVSDTLSGSAYSISNLSYENKSFGVGSQETNPQGVRFKSDGTKMFVVGATDDDVNEYDLSTAWDVSTATYSQNFSVASQDTIPTGVDFSPDGTKMYISGNSNRKLFQYTLSTAWDLSTASYASKSIASHSNSVGDVFIRPDGTSIYEVNNVADVVNQYDMTTAFDLSTASYTAQISVSSQETIPTALTFSADGTKMLVAGQVGDDINQYTLSTAWSVSTATFDNNPFSTTSQAGNPAGITFKDDGTKLYMVSNASDTVYQYSVFAGASVLLNFQDSAIPDLSGLNNIDTVGNAKVDGTDPTKYGSNAMRFDGSGDDLRIDVTDPISFSGYSGDFTTEMWVYPTAVGQSSNSYIWQHASSSTAYSPFIIVQRPSTYEFAIYASSNGSSWNLISNATIGTATANAWHHIAVVRDGTNIKAYMNGTVGSTSAVSTTALMTTSGQICIGSALGFSNSYFTGFIDDLRITKGIARYTANFTPPSEALPKF